MVLKAPPRAQDVTHQHHHGVVQGSIRVQRFRAVLDAVLPLHTQIDEGAGSGLLPFPIQDIVSCSLVLDCWEE